MKCTRLPTLRAALLPPQVTNLASRVLSHRLSRLDSSLLRVGKVPDPTKKEVRPC